MLARWISVIVFLLLATTITGARDVSAKTETGGWELLGKKEVAFNVDRDVISVGSRESQFKKIKLRVTGTDIRIFNLRVRYANGSVENLEVQSKLKRGDETKALDLAGRGRYIRQIELIYKSRKNSKKRATVEVYGLSHQPPKPTVELDAGWILLGKKQVGFQADRDIVEVGKKEGRFTHIRIYVLESAIALYDLKVVYGNGAVEDLQVREDIPAGGKTRAIDLAGKGRHISRVELIYGSRPDAGNRATVYVAGRAQGETTVEIPQGWDLLGEKKVGFGADRDVIGVDAKGQRYTRIRLRVRDNDIHLYDLKVVYGNGAVDDLQVREELRAGQSTRPIDLAGEDRLIERVELIYRSRSGSGKAAVVDVFGERASEPAWRRLGRKTVGFRVDHDVIRVGAADGTFRKLKLRVLDNDIYIHGMKVVYGNGSVEEWRVGAMIPAGGETRAIDLRGGNRRIEAIELLYQSRPSFIGKAELEVLGLQ